MNDIKSLKKYIIILVICIGGFMFYCQFIYDDSVWISTKINKHDLTIKVKQYIKKSGSYLKITGQFKNNDSLFEYVLYSQPFSLGPLAEQNPMCKVTYGKGNIKNEDYYICLSQKGLSFNSKQSFAMAQKDFLILNFFDSILKKDKKRYKLYTKKYQSIINYSRLIFSESDEGLFIETIKE